MSILVLTEIRETFKKIKNSEAAVIDAVRQNLLATESFFRSRYGSTTEYEKLPEKEKFKVLERMLDLEDDLLKKSKYVESISMKVFGLYLSTFLIAKTSANDDSFKFAARSLVESFLHDGILPQPLDC